MYEQNHDLPLHCCLQLTFIGWRILQGRMSLKDRKNWGSLRRYDWDDDCLKQHSQIEVSGTIFSR